jgi:uncharacterized membrane protein
MSALSKLAGYAASLFAIMFLIVSNGAILNPGRKWAVVLYMMLKMLAALSGAVCLITGVVGALYRRQSVTAKREIYEQVRREYAEELAAATEHWARAAVEQKINEEVKRRFAHLGKVSHGTTA